MVEDIHFPNLPSYRRAITETSQFPEKREEAYGWDSENPWFEYCVKATEPSLIVEVGTWLGASAVHLATLCKKHGFNAKVICVDTWLGGSEHYANPEWCATLDFKCGYPQLYYGFLRHIIESGCFDRIVPLPLDTKSGAEVLALQHLKPNLIYIDAGHSFDACLADLRNYAPLLDDDGLILGDDFRGQEVARAVGTFVSGAGGGGIFMFVTTSIFSAAESFPTLLITGLSLSW